MRLLCLNQFAPPDPAPTSRLLGELCAALEKDGWEVSIVSGAGGYRTGKPAGWRRWWWELQCHMSLMSRALRAERPDVVLCLTDPPGLPFTAAVIAWLRQAKLAHWAMDVYPDIAAALGEIRHESLVYRVVRALMQWAYRRCDLVVCLDEDMVEVLGMRHDPRLLLCPPWPPADVAVPRTLEAAQGSRVRWLYSGNLGRAHDYETLLRTQRILEDKGAPFDLVFQGHGNMRRCAMDMAAGLKLSHCRWVDYASNDDLLSSLLASHVLVATQRPQTRGLLWPSKLAILRELPRPIVWIGPHEGTISRTLREAGAGHGIFAPDDAVHLAGWLMENEGRIRQAGTRTPETGTLEAALKRQRDEGIRALCERLHKLVVAGTDFAVPP